MLNYAGCKECGSYGFPKEANKIKAEDDYGEETVDFERKLIYSSMVQCCIN